MAPNFLNLVKREAEDSDDWTGTTYRTRIFQPHVPHRIRTTTDFSFGTTEGNLTF